MTLTTDLVLYTEQPSSGELFSPVEGTHLVLPRIIADADQRTQERFFEFFAANIRNGNTRRAYARQVARFLAWCELRGVTALEQIRPMTVAAYIKELGGENVHGKEQTVKQALAAIRMLFDWLVVGQVVPMNPAHSVRGPKYSIKKGKTPVLSKEDVRRLLDSIDTGHVVGLRDRALIGLMVFSFARIGAVVGMTVEDYYQIGKRRWIRLHEKGGKFHEVPVHHLAKEYLDAYLDAAGIRLQGQTPLFRTSRGRSRKLTENGLSEREALDLVKRRATKAGLPATICNHTFRASGITAYLENGGTVENAQAIAAHESPRTTKLYDRRGDQINLDEIERIVI
ncbi:MAG TPA: tyrosine-type recombinase/integrase [Chthonomonadaceae bacterium]|nr:tyrosine-type recombinase/integrase [Chthonomonadaceae bacterium]